MKKVLITGGPTNEYIDEVMKITNMSSGKVAVELARCFVDAGYETTLLLTRNIQHPLLSALTDKENFALSRFETTTELLNSITLLSSLTQYDIVVHSVAVADYKPEFSFRAEDMAKEIAEKLIHAFQCRRGDCSLESQEEYRKIIFDTLTNPDCKVDDSTKISSVEPNLTVKLGLTPKIIASLRNLLPNAFICGFKLLENVPEEELIDAAVKQINKCKTDLCFANDLAQLRKGNLSRMVINKDGFTNIRVDGATGIFEAITNTI